MQANTFKVKVKEKLKERENYFKTITVEHRKKYNTGKKYIKFK